MANTMRKIAIFKNVRPQYLCNIKNERLKYEWKHYEKGIIDFARTAGFNNDTGAKWRKYYE